MMAGVVNFVPSDGPTFGNTATASPHLAAINFTGSTKYHTAVPCKSDARRTFNHLWTQVGHNISHYRSYPRLIGGAAAAVLVFVTHSECGGKNFHLVHASADLGSHLFACIGAIERRCGGERDGAGGV